MLSTNSKNTSKNGNESSINSYLPATYPGHPQMHSSITPFNREMQQKVAESGIYFNQLRSVNNEDRQIEEMRQHKFDEKQREMSLNTQIKLSEAQQKIMEQRKISEQLNRMGDLDQLRRRQRVIHLKSENDNIDTFQVINKDEILEASKVIDDGSVCKQFYSSNDLTSQNESTVVEGNQQKLFVLILLDESKNAKKYKDDIIVGMNKLICNQTLNKTGNSRMAILGYNDTINTIQEPECQHLVDVITQEKYVPNGSCAIYDVLEVAIKMIETSTDKDEKSLCLIFSLSDDNMSKSKQEQLKFAFRSLNSHRLARFNILTGKTKYWSDKFEFFERGVYKYSNTDLPHAFNLMDIIIDDFKKYFTSD